LIGGGKDLSEIVDPSLRPGKGKSGKADSPKKKRENDLEWGEIF